MKIYPHIANFFNEYLEFVFVLKIRLVAETAPETTTCRGGGLGWGVRVHLVEGGVIGHGSNMICLDVCAIISNWALNTQNRVNCSPFSTS